MQEEIRKIFLDSADLKRRMAETLVEDVAKGVEIIIECLQNGRTLLICGNGGSAADAQHFSAEFTNRFKLDRRPWPAIALTTDTSALTAIGNDSGFDFIFSKQVQALGRPGDILLVITTSDIETEPHGHSTNIAQALEAARAGQLTTIGLVSTKSQKILPWLDLALVVPHTETARIQEGHITILHCFCQFVEDRLARLSL